MTELTESVEIKGTRVFPGDLVEFRYDDRSAITMRFKEVVNEGNHAIGGFPAGILVAAIHEASGLATVTVLAVGGYQIGSVVIDCAGDAWQLRGHLWHLADSDLVEGKPLSFVRNFEPLRLVYAPEGDGK